MKKNLLAALFVVGLLVLALARPWVAFDLDKAGRRP